jgi:hypothetical protein
LDTDSTSWLENFKRLNGMDRTQPQLNETLPLPGIIARRPRKPHRLSVLVDLTRVDVMLGRHRRGPKACTCGARRTSTNRTK